jgi:hypothetical protein
MARYLFRLDKLHVNAVRDTAIAPGVDQDTVIYLIEVGARQFGPLKNNNVWNIHVGTEVDFTVAQRFDAKGVARGIWEIGPIEVADSDIVSVGYSVVNIVDALGRAKSGHTPPPDTIQQVTVGAAAALFGVASAAIGGAAGAILAVAAGLEAVFAGIFKGTPNCDGVVGGNKRSFTGAELREGTNNPQHAFSVTETTGNATKPDGCGTSEIVMTYSVIFWPSFSLVAFLNAKSAFTPTNRWTPGRGFRDYTKSVLPSLYTGPQTSAWDVLENWELLVVP